MIARRLLLVALVMSIPVVAMGSSINRPARGVISVDNMATNADAIAIVEVSAGEVRADRVPEALYHFKIMRAVTGTLASGACIEGPRGLRVGSRYLAFVDTARQKTGEQTHGCAVAGTIGDSTPRVLEIVTAPSGEDSVRLDNERILYPAFAGTKLVKQEVTDGDKSSTLIIGSWAPLNSVLDYVTSARKKAEAD
jgi:hypothetical protein